MNFNDSADYSRRRAYRVISPSVRDGSLRNFAIWRAEEGSGRPDSTSISTKEAGPEGRKAVFLTFIT